MVVDARLISLKMNRLHKKPKAICDIPWFLALLNLQN
jgi:hypothetical protein